MSLLKGINEQTEDALPPVQILIASIARGKSGNGTEIGLFNCIYNLNGLE